MKQISILAVALFCSVCMLAQTPITAECGSKVTIEAIVEPGHHFVRWSDGNTDAVRQVDVNDNVVYRAYFAADEFTLTLDAMYGIVSGDGTYPYGEEVTITATPDECYHFVRWSDGDTNATRTITITENMHLEAVFEINGHFTSSLK